MDNTYTHKPAGIKLAFLFASLFLLAYLVFCCFYLLSGYDYLAGWFSNLDPCFYRAAIWKEKYFTPGAKSTGNAFCVAGIIIGLTALWYLVRQYRASTPLRYPSINTFIKRSLFLPFALLAIWTISVWAYGNMQLAPSFDEVFSAVNCAGGHPFHALSYYMLPNNHIFFNVVNSFSPLSDKVLSGRLISLLAYLLLNWVSFRFFAGWFKNKWLAILASVILSLQFAVWGFGFQGRGYELLTLMQLLAFCSILYYCINGEEKWLQINALCCIIGYCCVPTFLYYHAAQFAGCILYCLLYKKTIRQSWKYHFIIVLCVFIWYTPAFCFSGASAILHNKYVSPGTDSATGPIASILPTLSTYIPYCFSLGDEQLPRIAAIILFLCPALLFINRKSKTSVLVALFYFTLWAVTLLFIISMKKGPFHRTLIGHYAITFMAIIYTCHVIALFFANKLHAPAATWLFMLLILAPAGFHLAAAGNKNLSQNLYFNNINGTHAIVDEGMASISSGSTLACSDEGFYFYYLGTRKGFKAHKCINGNEDYLIKNNDEPMPHNMEGFYFPIKEIMDYTLYKRR